MSTNEPLAAIDYQDSALAEVLEFLKRTRNELRMLRKVHVGTDFFQVFDINGDYFEIRGVGFPDEDIIPILKAVNTPFHPDRIHQPTSDEYKEFKTGRRHPWAEDRVM